MVNFKLVEYIKKEVENGYSYNTVRNYLINYGYSPSEVDTAISYIQSYAQNPEEILERISLRELFKKHIKLLLIFFILIFVVVAVILFSPLFNPEKVEYFQPVIVNKILEEGEPLIINFDYEDIKGEVVLKIISEGNVLVDKKIPLVKEQQEVSINLQSGDYEVSMEINGFSKKEYIRVVEKIAEEPTATSLTDIIQREEPRESAAAAGMQRAEVNETILNITQIQCSTLEGTYYDVCLDDNAKVTKNPALCIAINDQFRKEACIMRIVSEINDYSLCDALTIEQFVKLCRQLERTQKQSLGASESVEGVSTAEEMEKIEDSQITITNIIKNVFGNIIVIEFNTSREISPIIFYDTTDLFLENQKNYGLNMTHRLPLGPLEKGKYFFKIKLDSLETDTDSFVIN